jgi:hypothetical protein
MNETFCDVTADLNTPLSKDYGQKFIFLPETISLLEKRY